jgi:hypothetical protein
MECGGHAVFPRRYRRSRPSLDKMTRGARTARLLPHCGSEMARRSNDCAIHRAMVAGAISQQCGHVCECRTAFFTQRRAAEVLPADTSPALAGPRCGSRLRADGGWHGCLRPRGRRWPTTMRFPSRFSALWASSQLFTPGTAGTETTGDWGGMAAEDEKAR